MKTITLPKTGAILEVEAIRSRLLEIRSYEPSDRARVRELHLERDRIFADLCHLLCGEAEEHANASRLQYRIRIGLPYLERERARTEWAVEVSDQNPFGASLEISTPDRYRCSYSSAVLDISHDIRSGVALKTRRGDRTVRLGLDKAEEALGLWIAEYRRGLEDGASEQQASDLVNKIGRKIAEPEVRDRLIASLADALRGGTWEVYGCVANTRIEFEVKTQMGDVSGQVGLSSPETFLSLLDSLLAEQPPVP